jgi:hypothetical protein
MADFAYTYNRSQWEVTGYTVAQHTGSGPVNWGLVNKVVIHYTAAPDVPDGDSDELPWFSAVRGYIRAIQKDYVTSRGYSIGYNVCVDQQGNSWELRGQEYMCAANEGVNATSYAVLVMVDGNDPTTPAAAQTIRNIVGWAKTQAANPVTVVGHKDVGSTACPGTGVYDQIKAGVFNPGTLPPPVIDGDDMITIEPKREYDTRPNQFRPDGTPIPGGNQGPFGAGEVRRVPVVFGTKAFIHVTAGAGSLPGFISVSADGSFAGGTSLVNTVVGDWRHDGAPVSAPGGHVYIKASQACHLFIDVYAIG